MKVIHNTSKSQVQMVKSCNYCRSYYFIPQGSFRFCVNISQYGTNCKIERKMKSLKDKWFCASFIFSLMFSRFISRVWQVVTKVVTVKQGNIHVKCWSSNKLSFLGYHDESGPIFKDSLLVVTLANQDFLVVWRAYLDVRKNVLKI